MDLRSLTITEAARLLHAKEVSAVELAQAHIDAIKNIEPGIHAFLEVFDDVLQQAKEADARIALGTATTLTGIPIAVKDNILIKGKISSGGSKILANYRASYDAGVIEKLKSAQAVLIGRTNMDEFALGSSTENSAYGPTKNPHDVSRVPGGTSGGSAAAVAAHMVLGALGSDTGGSIRQPAAFSGVVGIKPTYGSVSRYGLIAAASSLDQIGTLAKNVTDAETLFNAITGQDMRDSTSVSQNAYPPVSSKKRIGIPRDFLSAGVDADIRAQFDATLIRLIAQGYEVVDISLPTFAHALAAYYIINPAEVSSNLSRFDGIRYGFSVEAEDIRKVYEQSRGQGFGREARRRILVGAFVLSSGYVDAYYRKAQAVREAMRAELAQVFDAVDYIVTPTTPTPAFKLGEKEDPLAMYAGDIFTVPVNLTGVPAISVPSGNVVRDSVSLPVGFQAIARHGGEASLFALGRDIERN
ncbi:MAG: Asp-tRNA(Asn)/Glu-tRNA(Gln) amidotransferase subunit GatA [Minisyncoccia bacterium]